MIEFDYVKGDGTPDIPVICISLRIGTKKIGGQAIVDTGFDGGIYPNSILAGFLLGLRPVGREFLEGVSGEVECDVFELDAELFYSSEGAKKSIGTAKIYLPLDKENLTQDVVVGREILNNLDIRLNGKVVMIYD